MKNKLSILIAHYYPKGADYDNPLQKTLEKIDKQSLAFDVEVIIADDGSSYTKDALKNYSEKVDIHNDARDIYLLEGKALKSMLKNISLKSDLIKKWVYLPKLIKCMSKARVLNYAIKFAQNDNLLFLDDDNYFISNNSIENLLNLFDKYDFIVGQIKDNGGRYRAYTSNRVQGTTIALKKDIILAVNGFGEWTEEHSCGIDADLWIKLYDYFSKNNSLKACYTNAVSTYDSQSKRWGKYTKIFKEWNLRKAFKEIHKCKNFRNKKYNLSRNKSLWLDNLIE